MRIQAENAGSGFVLYQGDRRIGYLRGDLVGFMGFATETEAAQAASLAHRALVRRRAGAAAGSSDEYFFGHTEEGQYVIARSGLIARLVPPDPVTGEDAWGFETSLEPEESVGIFAMARARLMWSALRASGVTRRMSQFTAAVSPDAAS